jgi:hypothetical protein
MNGGDSHKYMKIIARTLLAIFLLVGSLLLALIVWMAWLEPMHIERKLLTTFCKPNETVRSVFDGMVKQHAITSWECTASDVAVACTLHNQSTAKTYLFGIDSDGFYPANGQTLRMCSFLSRNLDSAPYGDEEVIPGHDFRQRRKSG